MQWTARAMRNARYARAATLDCRFGKRLLHEAADDAITANE